MLNRTGLCLLVGVVAALPACGSASDNNFSDPAAAGSAMKGGASGSSGAAAKGGSSGDSGAAGKGGTSSDMGGSSMGGSGGSGGSTGGTGGSDVGGTGMGGSATQGGSSGDTTTGGTGMATGGTDPGTGGTDPGTGGTDPGTGGTGMATGGAGGKGGNGGSGGKANCDELAMQYVDALNAARACNADSHQEQCTDTMPSSLTCGCDVFVNPDNTEALAELRRLRKAGASCDMPCPQLACIELGQGECAAEAGGDGACRSTGAILQ